MWASLISNSLPFLSSVFLQLTLLLSSYSPSISLFVSFSNLCLASERKTLKMAKNGVIGSFGPFLVMVIVQVCYAGMNITSKLALESGMNPLVLVAYRQIFATLAIAPFGYWMERQTRPKMTLPILFQIFMCSLTGAVANQVFYYVGLKYSSAIIGTALSNLLPAVTFIFALIFRQESANLKKKSGLAKIGGTALCVGGAMLLSFYHGHTIGLGESSIHWSYLEKAAAKDSSSSNNTNVLLGPIFVILSVVGWSIWFIIQAGVSEKYPAPYTSTTLMCLMSSIQCGAIGLAAEHRKSAWSLRNPAYLVASLYAGVLASALAFFLTSWTIQRRGPLYVSIFSPLLLIVVAILSWALLSEKLYVGTAVGSILIVGGLYFVLWGKSKEMKKQEVIIEEAVKLPKLDEKDEMTLSDLELQPPCGHSNEKVRKNIEKRGLAG